MSSAALVIWRQLWRSKHSCSRHHTYYSKSRVRVWRAERCLSAALRLCTPVSVILSHLWRSKHSCSRHHTYSSRSGEWGCGEQRAAWVLHWGSALLCRWSGRSYEEVSTAVLVITLTWSEVESEGCGEQRAAWVLHWGSALLCRWSGVAAMKK